MTEHALEIPRAFRELWTPSRYKVYHGGRGSGKSHSVAAALVQQGYDRTLRIGCYREIQKSIAGSVKKLLDDKIVEMGLSGFYSSTEYAIRGQNGTEFMFGGLRTNPDSIKSTEGLDIAWVEEADKCSQPSLDILTPTLRKPGSEIWFTFNRKNTTDPVDKMFLGGAPPPNSIIRKVNWRENPWFPTELETEMLWLKGRDIDKWLHVWEGEPLKRSQSRVFNNWRIDDIDAAMPVGCVPRFGGDWGFAQDPTVLIKAFVWDRTLYIRNEAWKVRCEIDDTPALFAGNDERVPPRWQNRHKYPGVPGAARSRIVADSARPETISYMKARGFDIMSARKGANSVVDGIEFMQSFDIVIHPDCKHVEDEMTLYSYRVDPMTDEVLSELADKENHTIDACRYALEGVRRRSGTLIAITPPEIIHYAQ